MKIKDFLNTYKILDESYIASDYTWGFELEGICTTPQKDHYLPSYHSNAEPEGTAKELKDNLDELFDSANMVSKESILKPIKKKQKEKWGNAYGNIGSDGSVRASPSKGGWSFEYASGVFQFSVKGALEVLKILYEELPKLNVYTNNTCGFHTHASLPHFTREEAVWIICCLSIDGELIHELTELEVDDIKIDFYDNTYANKNFYGLIEDGLINKNYERVSQIVSGISTNDSNGKYRNLRLHPDKGTLEWRGPRNFLNENNYELIKGYIKKFYKVLQIYSRILHADKWKGQVVSISREEIDKNVHLSGSFDTHDEKRKKASNDKLADIVKNNLEKLLSLRPQQVLTLFQQYPYYFITNGNEIILNKLWNKFNEQTLTDIFNDISTEYAFKWIKLMDDENMYFPIYKNMINNLGTYATEDCVLKHINFINEDLILAYPGFAPNIKRKVIKYASTNSSNIPMELWNKLLDPKYFSLIMYMEMPVKIQRKLVKKNPYNIQYIKNPDQSVIDMAMKKVPNIDQFIPRI